MFASDSTVPLKEKQFLGSIEDSVSPNSSCERAVNHENLLPSLIWVWITLEEYMGP